MFRISNFYCFLSCLDIDHWTKYMLISSYSILFFCIRFMKDIVKRVLIGFVSGALLGYLFFLFTQQISIVQGPFLAYNTLYFVVLFVICLILFILFAVYPVHFKMTKWTLFAFWLFLIIIWKTVLLNDIDHKVYVGDIFALLGVILTLLAWTNILITDKVRKTKADKKIEIIEV